MAELWRITLQIQTQTAFHTLGPGHTLPLLDRMVQVDATGRPLIPGSGVRGRTRAHLERLLKTSGQVVCSPPRPDQTCPHSPSIRKDLEKLAEPYCLACRIFGSAWRESAVSFGNFYLIKNDGGAVENFAERTSVSLNRRLNTAEAGRLLVMQTTAPGAALTFSGLVEGRLKREELAWLLAAFRLVTHLGGSKARGLGRIALKVTELQRWDTSTQPPQWIMVEARSIMEEVLKDAPL